VNLRVRLLVAGDDAPLPRLQPERGRPLLGRRAVWFDRPRRTAVYERARLAPGSTIRGPAIVVQMDATTAVPPGWRGAVDGLGNLLLSPPRGSSRRR
jgi:N-methylhydantoinase A